MAASGVGAIRSRDHRALREPHRTATPESSDQGLFVTVSGHDGVVLGVSIPCDGVESQGEQVQNVALCRPSMGRTSRTYTMRGSERRCDCPRRDREAFSAITPLWITIAKIEHSGVG